VDIYCIKIVDIISVMNIVLIKGVLFPGCFNEKTGKTLESKNAPQMAIVYKRQNL